LKSLKFCSIIQYSGCFTYVNIYMKHTCKVLVCMIFAQYIYTVGPHGVANSFTYRVFLIKIHGVVYTR